MQLLTVLLQSSMLRAIYGIPLTLMASVASTQTPQATFRSLRPQMFTMLAHHQLLLLLANRVCSVSQLRRN